MRLICLNTWGGKIFDPLLQYLSEQTPTTDIFCLQEIFSSADGPEWSGDTRTHLDRDVEKILSDFDTRYALGQKGFDKVGPVSFDIARCEATYTQKKYTVLSSRSVPLYVFSETSTDPRKQSSSMQIVEIAAAHHAQFTLCNIHGIAFPVDKLDCEERLLQATRILDVLAKIKGAKILCGDFNLMPDTESIRMIERAGMRNLIRECGIQTTRSTLNPWHGTPQQQNFADYVFTTPGIHVDNFSVPVVVVSDHLPLVLDFELR